MTVRTEYRSQTCVSECFKINI